MSRFNVVLVAEDSSPNSCLRLPARNPRPLWQHVDEPGFYTNFMGMLGTLA